jgi:hypothetical protein
MGMEGWALWTSWLVDALLVRLVTLAIVVVLLKVEMEHDTGAVLRYSDGSVLYFMLLVYTIAAVCSCFFVTTFFSRRKCPFYNDTLFYSFMHALYITILYVWHGSNNQN